MYIYIYIDILSLLIIQFISFISNPITLTFEKIYKIKKKINFKIEISILIYYKMKKLQYIIYEKY